MKKQLMGVVGAGTIGASWTALFLARGLDVVVCDPDGAAEQSVRDYLPGAWKALEELDLFVPSRVPPTLRFEKDLRRALSGVDFVQENAPERLGLKVDLLSRIDDIVPERVIVASSTSGLLMTDMQKDCRHPERFVIGHPFNPPHLIPLVEVVGGRLTSAGTIQAAMDFYAGLGKRPIHVRREVPGHIANRLQAAVWREAIHLVQQGVGSVSDIDAAMADGPGLRWALNGPHMTFHMGGGTHGLHHFMAHLLGSMEKWWADLGNPSLTRELQEALVAGVLTEAAGRPVAELAAQRDAALVRIMRARGNGVD